MLIIKQKDKNSFNIFSYHSRKLSDLIAIKLMMKWNLNTQLLLQNIY